MLTHMARAGAIELEQAESAHEEAQLAFAQANTQENMALLWQAADWAKHRALNVEWFAFKWKALDEDGVYILTDDSQLVHLTEQRKS